MVFGPLVEMMAWLNGLTLFLESSGSDSKHSLISWVMSQEKHLSDVFLTELRVIA